MAHVIYNNQEVFPVPFVTHSLQPLFRGDGRRIGYADKYVLNGQVTGCCFSGVTGNLATILDIFSTDFKDLQFTDINFTGIASGAKVESINVDSSTQVGVVNYTVEMLAYPQQYFETQGVLEKKNEWSTQLNQNGELTTVHTIFAKGINTAPSYDNALDNAKNFVLTQTGLTIPVLFPFFISGFSGKLDTRSEVINRLDGSYTITENYIASTGLPSVINYSLNIESGNDGIISIGVNGSFKVGGGVTFDIARQSYSGFNSYALASGAYVNYRGITGLLPIPASSGIVEDYSSHSLNFDISYNDFPTTRYRHIFNTQVVSGTDSILTANVNGRIEGLGRQNVRYDNAYNFFTGLNILAEVQQAFTDYVGVGYPYPLNIYPLSSGNTLDRFNGVIEYNLGFNNKAPVIQCSGIKFFDVSYNKQYAMPQISPISIPNSISGLDTVFLDYLSRGTIEANGTVTVDKPLTSMEATGAVRQFINGKFRREILASGSKTKLRLENVSLNQNINTDTCSFSVSYSFDEPACVNTAIDFCFITGLCL